MKWILKGAKKPFRKSDTSIWSSAFLRLMCIRGFSENELESYVNPKSEKIDAEEKIKGIRETCEYLLKEDRKNIKILIYGDYDADGIMSTYVLFNGLGLLGFNNVKYYIPDRENDGYGLSVESLQKFNLDSFDLVITCDNGISAISAIDYLKQNNKMVIVTDHHEPIIIDGEEKLPDADYIINPKCQVNAELKFKEYCGATVSFFLIKQLSKLLKIENIYQNFMPFITIATICDVMPIIEDNRAIVSDGLKAIRNTDNIGLKKLIEVLELDIDKINTYHIGFLIGPCLNATGRLETAKIALDLLNETDLDKAKKHAKYLVELNNKRKQMTEDGTKKAIEIINAESLNENNFIIVHVDDVHESIAGIIAGRIREKYNRPALIFTDSKSEFLKGSGRSIEGIDIYFYLSKFRELFNSFGGHAMACGASITKENLVKLNNELNKLNIDSELFERKIKIDLKLPLAAVNFKLLDEIEYMAPFGKENDKPIFADRRLTIVNTKVYNSKIDVYKFLIKDSNNNLRNGIFFDRDKILPEMINKEFGDGEYDRLITNKFDRFVDMIFQIEKNEYMGKTSIQLKIMYFRKN